MKKSHTGNDLTKKRDDPRDLFETIAPLYDRVNDVISGGFHRKWIRKAAKYLTPKDGFKVLDVASGTCGFALELAKQFSYSPGLILASDISWNMLKIGREKVEKSSYSDMFQFCIASAEDIPFVDNYFDIVTISYGMKNISDIEKFLKETVRVLKPGGSFLSLELGKPEKPVLKELYVLYISKIIPHIGKAILGKASPYYDLSRYIIDFPSPKDFHCILKDSGLEKTGYEKLFGGAAFIHYATKPTHA